MADRRDILVNLLGKETVSAAAGKAGKGLDDLADAFKATEKDAGGLDKQIGEVEQSLRDLAVMYSRTADAAEQMDITKAIRKQESELRRLTKSRGLLGDFGKAGEDAASGFGVSFIGRLGPLIAKAPLGPAGAAAGATVAAVMAPMIGAAMSGAVLGGVGVGGVVGGVALAAKDSRVQAAASALGNTVMGDLQRSATRFVQPTVHGIRIISSAWSDVSGDVDASFSATSRYVVPLARGIAGAIREIAPGWRDAAVAAEPVVREIADGITRLGDATGDVLSDMSDNADEAAGGMRGVFIAAETGIRVGGALLSIFSDMFGAVVKVGQGVAAVQDFMLGWIPGIGSITDSWVSNWDEMGEAMDTAGKTGGEAGSELSASLQGLMDDFTGTKEKVTDAVTALQEWRTALDEMTGTNLSARQAQRDLEQAIDDASAAVRENGETAIKNGAALDINSAKGRANAAALDKIAQEANDAHAAILKQTGSQELANAASDRGRARFLALADKMGLSKTAARLLADQLFRIKDRHVTVTANTAPAMTAAQAAVARINSMRASIMVQANPSGAFGGNRHSGAGNAPGMSVGGPVVGPGPKGVDSELRRLAVGEHVLTAAEVDAAGGHSQIAAWRKSLRTGQRASASVATPAAAIGGRGNSYHITVNVAPGGNPAEVGRQTVELIRAYERSSGKGWRS